MRKLQWGARRTRASIVGAAYALGLVACAGQSTDEGVASVPGLLSESQANAAAPSSRATCDRLLTELRNQLLTQVSERAEQARLSRAPDDGGGVSIDGAASAFRVAVPAAPAAAPSVQGSDIAQGSDIVQTDGDFIYLLHGSDLFMLGAEPAAATEILATAPIEGQPLELLVSNDRVVVFSAVSAPLPGSEDESSRYPDDNPTYTKLTVFDAASGTLEVLRESYVEGVYGSARRSGDLVNLLLQQSPKPQLDAPSISYVDIFGRPLTQAEIDPQVALWALLSTESIEDSTIEDYVPTTFERVGGELVRQSLNCDDYLLPGPVPAQAGLTTVISLDLGTASAPLGNFTLLGAARGFNAGTDTIMLSQFDYIDDDETRPLVETYLHRLAIGGRITYTGMGRVAGTILNVAESNGVIRVLTLQNRYAKDPAGGGDVYAGALTHVVTLAADTFAELGRSADLNPDEYVTSSRFVGDRAYLLTTGQVTGLSVMDLSDPAAPAILGQVRTMGSTYNIFPFSTDMLIGIGVGVDPTVTVQNVALQLFDVSNPSVPTLAHELVFAEPGYSAALNDSHALSFDPKRNAIALPFQSYTTGASSLEAFVVSVAAGFSHLGSVVPPPPDPTLLECLQILGYPMDAEFLAQLEQDPGLAGALLESCRVSDVDTVRRGLFRGKARFAIGDRTVTAYSLASLTDPPLSQVSLEHSN